jgi:filamentous hemagglutinin family protein
MSRLRQLLLITPTLLPMGLTPAIAGPNGATVVGGAATVQGQGTAAVVVNQSSQSAIINWNTFNIGLGESTKINMPGASSVELDRVTGGLGPSQIYGSLSSNGQVFLVNPDGILIGPSGKVDTASFLATTHDIANSDFMAGRYNFSIPGMPNSSVVNQGAITAQTGGFAALVAPGVRNTGTITAKLGTVALASGNSFTLDFYGDNLITLGVNDSIAATVLDVSTGQPLSALVSNEGTLKANGGRVELTAVAARQVVDSVINNTGVIEANSVGMHNGTIVLGAATDASKPTGTPTQTVKVSGKLSAVGKKKGTTGGTIEVTGENIQVSGANIKASGPAGGGTVLIGGDWGGGNPNTSLVWNSGAHLEPYAVPNSTTVSVDAATTINASATVAGNGGKVIVWSNEATTFYGTIVARGGAQSGDGGFVETSGHRTLSFNGTVDTSAANGQNGTLLLDPSDFQIYQPVECEDSCTVPVGISYVALEHALASGNVTLATNPLGTELGDLTVNASVIWSSANTLSLNAYHDIIINTGETIANTGAGSLSLRADSTGTGAGTVTFNGTGKVDFSQSTGSVSIFYNPADNPAGSVVNATSYATPFDYSPFVLVNSAVQNQLTAYMLVNSVYDLQNIQNNLSGDYALGTNIDASATVNWDGGAGFVPIGTQNGPFNGIVDGQSHTIDTLTILSGTVSSYYAALFEWIGYTGQVKNVNLLNTSVPNNSGGIFGLAYTNEGTITGANVSGTAEVGLVGLNIGTIDLSSFEGSVTAAGLVGSNSGTISRSFAQGSLQTTCNFNTGCYIGGLVSGNAGTITQSYSDISISVLTLGNAIVGGLAGQNAGKIIQSYALGTVSASGNGDATVAGLVGDNYGGAISQSYAVGTVSASNAGLAARGLSCGSNCVPVPPTTCGLACSAGNSTNAYWDLQTTGQNSSVSGVGLTTAQFKLGLPSGFDPTEWGSNPSTNNGYPYLLWTQTLSPPTLNYVATPITQPYGSPIPSLLGMVTGFQNGDTQSSATTGTLAFTTTATQSSNAGSYPITGSGLTANGGNYTFAQAPANATAFTITPAVLTVTANDVTIVQGRPLPTFTASYSGFVLGQGPSILSGLIFTTAAKANLTPGDYSIVPSGATAPNYTLNFVDGLLVILPMPSVPPAQDQISLPPVSLINYFLTYLQTRNAIAVEYVIDNAEVKTQVAGLVSDLMIGGTVTTIAGDTAGLAESIMQDIADQVKNTQAINPTNVIGSTEQFVGIVSQAFVDVFGAGVLAPIGGPYGFDIVKIATAAATAYAYGFAVGQ